ALVRSDRCRAPPIPRDRGALMADIETSATTATSQWRVLFPGAASHLPGFWVTRLTRVHVIRPSGLPLACDQWMEHRSLGFLPGFTPRRYQRRMPGAETSAEHSLVSNRRSFDPPFFSVISLNQCDITSHLDPPVGSDQAREAFGSGLLSGEGGDAQCGD